MVYIAGMQKRGFARRPLLIQSHNTNYVANAVNCVGHGSSNMYESVKVQNTCRSPYQVWSAVTVPQQNKTKHPTGLHCTVKDVWLSRECSEAARETGFLILTQTQACRIGEAPVGGDITYWLESLVTKQRVYRWKENWHAEKCTCASQHPGTKKGVCTSIGFEVWNRPGKFLQTLSQYNW